MLFFPLCSPGTNINRLLQNLQLMSFVVLRMDLMQMLLMTQNRNFSMCHIHYLRRHIKNFGLLH